MGKLEEIFATIDEEAVIAIESETKQHFFGTKKELNKQDDVLFKLNVKDTQDINGILCITVC